jgi:hypothetical protein
MCLFFRWANKFEEQKRRRAQLTKSRALPKAIAQSFQKEKQLAYAYFEAHGLIRTPLVSGHSSKPQHFFARAMAERHGLLLKSTGNAGPHQIVSSAELEVDSLGQAIQCECLPLDLEKYCVVLLLGHLSDLMSVIPKLRPAHSIGSIRTCRYVLSGLVTLKVRLLLSKKIPSHCKCRVLDA